MDSGHSQNVKNPIKSSYLTKKHIIYEKSTLRKAYHIADFGLTGRRVVIKCTQ